MPDLDHEMRQILAAMSILSCGTTQSWNTNGGGHSVEDRNPIPPGGRDNLPDYWAGEYNRALDNARRAEVIANARDALRRERVQAPATRPPGETPAEELKRKTERVLRLHQDGVWTRAEIAADVRLTIFEVRRIVAGAVLEEPVVVGELRETVVRLRAENLSQSQIARKLGVSQPTVCRLLRGAA